MRLFEVKSLIFFVFLLLFLSTGFFIAHWITVLIVCVLVLLFFPRLHWDVSSEVKKIGIPWIVFLIAVGASVYSTISIPASFEELFIYISFSLAFLIALLIPRRHLTITQFLHVFHSILVALSLISIGNYVFNLIDIQSHINLVQYYYGHNHLASLLLVGLPTSFYFAFKRKIKIYKYVYYFLFVSLLLTMGRVAIVFGILQIVYILIHSKFLVNKKQIALLVFALIAFTGIFSLSSFSNSITESFCNPSQKYSVVFCKKISAEGRFLYWRQAIEGWKTNPLFGTGPGTFFITNEKFRQAIHLDVNYAHNAYLKSFSELGLVGGVAFLLLFGMVFTQVKKLIRDSNKHFFIIIGLVTFFTYILFDFDFSIKSIQLFILFYLGLLLREKKQRIEVGSRANKSVIVVLTTLLSLTVLFAAFYLYLLLNSELIEKNTLYLINSQKQYYFENVSRHKLKAYFVNDLEYYLYFFSDLPEEEKGISVAKIRELSPYTYLQNYSKSYYYYKHDSSEFIDTSKYLIELVEQSERVAGEYYYQLRKDLGEKILFEYARAIKDQRFELEFEYIQLIERVYPWYLGEVEFDRYEDNLQTCPVILDWLSLDAQFLGKMRQEFSDLALKCVLYCNLSSELSCENLNFVDNYLYLTNAHPDSLLHKYAYQLSEMSLEDSYTAEQVFAQMSLNKKILDEIVSRSEIDLSEYQKEQLAVLYVTAANRVFSEDVTLASSLYEIASEFKNNILYSQDNFIIDATHDVFSDKELFVFTDIVSSDSHLFVVLKKRNLIQIYQRVVNQFIARDSEKDAIDALKSMQSISSDEIYSQSQLGNYYLFTSNFEEAVKEYQLCNAESQVENEICEVGMQYAQSRESRDLYSDISQLILSDSFLSE